MSKDKLDWLKTHNEQTSRVGEIGTILSRISSSLLRVGNRDLGEELDHYAGVLLVAEKKLNSAVGQSINEQFKTQQDMSASILNAALAGVKLGEGEIK